VSKLDELANELSSIAKAKRKNMEKMEIYIAVILDTEKTDRPSPDNFMDKVLSYKIEDVRLNKLLKEKSDVFQKLLRGDK